MHRMLERFLIVLGQVGALFLLMGVGFTLEKLGKLDKIGTGQMTYLLLYVVAPCIVVDSFQVPCDPALLRTLGVGALALTACYAAYVLLAHVFFRREEPKRRGTYRFGAIYGNIGFMGIPLVRSVLGESATIFAVLNLSFFNIITWTQGILMIGGRKEVSLKKAVLNPGVLGVVFGLPLFLLGLRLPGPLYNVVHMFSEINTPLAMVIIGAQMARADLLGTFRAKKLYVAAGVKLLLLPAVTALVLAPLPVDRSFFATIVILAATPAAGLVGMFSERFQTCPEEGAQLVTLTTLLSIFTLPIVGTLAQLG